MIKGRTTAHPQPANSTQGDNVSRADLARLESIVAGRLDLVLDEIRTLRADLNASRAQLTDQDIELVTGLAQEFGRRPFSAADAFKIAALRPLFDRAGATNPRSLGKRLARIEGAQCRDFRVSKIGDVEAGAFWKIETRSPEFETQPNSGTPLRALPARGYIGRG